MEKLFICIERIKIGFFAIDVDLAYLPIENKRLPDLDSSSGISF